MVTAPPSGRLSVAFVLRPSFTLLPFSAMIDTLRLAADDGDRSRPIRCTWTVVGRNTEPVTASCGVEIVASETYGDVRRFDLIVVVGGLLQADTSLDAETAAYLRAADREGLTIVGLCTGAFTMLRAGLLDGRHCCIHWYHLRDIVGQFPRTKPVADRIFTVDGRYITCAGGMAAVDVGVWIVEHFLGRAAAQKCANLLLLDHARSASAAQPQPPAPSLAASNRVRRAMLIIEQSLAEPVGTEALARQLNVSGRHLERLFRDELGMSVQDYSRQLRLRCGLWLLATTRQSITAVADACGFADASHFSRLCRKTFGQRPSAFTPAQVETIVANFQFPGVSCSDRVDAVTASSRRVVRTPLGVTETVAS
jgi:transcriptional regulator GlxA family with amidase domain